MLSEERKRRFGDIVGASALKIPRVVDLGRYLGENPEGQYVKLLEFRTGSIPNVEHVLFEVEVERPQHPVADIRRIELLAASFSHDDCRAPEVLALRESFPEVPHLTLRLERYPKGLCLYSQDFQEIRFSWTPANFIGRIREWLTRAARGDLHMDDQPLEPLLVFQGFRLIIPHALKADVLTARPVPLSVKKTDASDRSHTFVASPLPDNQLPTKGEYLISTFQTPPVTHGIVNRHPEHLEALNALYEPTGLDIVHLLRKRIRDWHLDHAQRHLLNFKLILLIFQPRKRRPEDTLPETTERWAFCIPSTLEDIGRKLNVLDTARGTGAGLLIGDAAVDDTRLHEIGLVPMVVHETLSAEVAEIQNQFKAAMPKITAIGAGALGSQTILNLHRAGHRDWNIVDNDVFLPHNGARHALTGWAIGHNKAESMVRFLSDVLDEPPIVTALPIDVLNPSDECRDKLEAALSEAGLILDFSASVAVGKMLSTSSKMERCISAFITPDANSLVILAEDKLRKCRLDWLEMLHYRAVLLADLLGSSFAPDGHRFRYGNSCRDISISLPQAKTAIYAGVAALQIAEMVGQPGARCTVFQLQQSTCAVTPVEVAISPVREFSNNGWALRVDEATLDCMRQYRQDRLPNETGGILLGNFDTHRRICSVVTAVPSPPDSEEWPACYIRGTKGLRDIVTKAELLTGGQVGYVGEWHSHPNGCSVRPSVDDKGAFTQLSTIMQKEALPAAILIIGQKKAVAAML